MPGSARRNFRDGQATTATAIYMGFPRKRCFSRLYSSSLHDSGSEFASEKGKVAGRRVRRPLSVRPWGPETVPTGLEADGYIVERLFFDFSFPGIVTRGTAGQRSVLLVYVIH